MKKWIKYTVCILMLSAIISTLCGCHDVYCVEIGYGGKNMPGTMVDMLIAMDENDNNYVKASWASKQIFGDEASVEKTQIAQYSDDGYVSMLVHYHFQEYEHSQESSELHFNGKAEFNRLCNQYSTFRIAVLDMDGNVLQVSDVYPFKTSENYYLDSPIQYDFETNILSPVYKRTGFAVLWEVLAAIIAEIAPLPAAALLIAWIVIRLRDSTVLPKIYQSVIYTLLCLPSVVYLAFRLDDAVKSTYTNQAAWERFWQDIGSMDPVNILYAGIPYIANLIFTVWAAIILLRKNRDTCKEA